MLVATATRYGSPDVITLAERTRPTIAADEVLVAVAPSPVTQGDRRVRAADFGKAGWLPGRLLMGLFEPRHPELGTNFAGRVVEVGAEVTRFSVGDRVFGAVPHGGAAEYLAIAQNAAIAHTPASLSDAEASTLPYGATTARTFLVDIAGVQPGERVVVVGAAGGVGRAAVQIAVHLGARVTAVCSGADAELVRSLGAEEVIDYRQTTYHELEREWDVIFDTAETNHFRKAKRVLAEGGRYATVTLSVGIVAQMALTGIVGKRKALFGIAEPNAETLATLAQIAEQGALRPVIGGRWPLRQIADAHRALETDRPKGHVVLEVAALGPRSMAVAA